jgi:hypothetical protein
LTCRFDALQDARMLELPFVPAEEKRFGIFFKTFASSRLVFLTVCGKAGSVAGTWAAAVSGPLGLASAARIDTAQRRYRKPGESHQLPRVPHVVG